MQIEVEDLIRVGGPAVKDPEQNRSDKVGSLYIQVLMEISKMMVSNIHCGRTSMQPQTDSSRTERNLKREVGT